uniref:hypothetical protein n=1 Tax=Marinobacterium profundum TaxID=1714300 RepID=UPI00082F56AF|nr:hypothetical protein [Marinobacterium profundum]
MIDISIGRMNLRLAPVFRDRASAIAREIGAGLRQQFAGDPSLGRLEANFETLDVAPLRLNPGLSDRRLGMQIAAAICQQLRARSAQEM